MTGHRIDLPEMPVGAKFTGEYIEGGVKVVFEKEKHKKECDNQPLKGHKYLCTNSVEMVGYIAFIKGDEYISEKDNYLTNSNGNINHYLGSTFFAKHFRNT